MSSSHPLLPDRKKARIALARGRILHMSIMPKTNEMDVLLRLSGTDRDCRNALHQAMKRGVDVALGYEAAELVVIEGERSE